MDLPLHKLPWLVRPDPDFAALCRALPGEKPGAAIRKLASAALDENQLNRLAKVISAAQSAGRELAPLQPFRLAILSNSTTHFLMPCLTATAARYGFSLQAMTPGYGQIAQVTLDAKSELYDFEPHAVLIAIDWHGLPIPNIPGGDAIAAVDAVMQMLGTIRSNIKAHGNGAVSILQTIAPPIERFVGSFERALPGGRRQIIECVNQRLAESMLHSGDALFDVAGLAEAVGLENWHSPQEYNLARIPFASTYTPLYADHFCRIVSALRGKSRRCVVLDLDNTLWGGVIGDDGLAGIQLAEGDATGEAFRELQRYLLNLRSYGVVLAVSSKNEDENARAPFRQHPEMILREEHFAVFQVNWQDKVTNIRAVADQLRLGLDSLVFVDDNPFERRLVRESLPEVAVPELPDDPAQFARTLAAAGYFEATSFSSEDAKRTEYYHHNAMRAALARDTPDIEAYLATLAMKITFQAFDETNRARIAQLINKSNQFNLTTRRYSEADVERMQHDPRCFTLQVRLEDTFGDNGMISVVICREAESSSTWEIDTWLMSCRVLGRGVENAVLRQILARAIPLGVDTLVGCYIPTGRNKLVKDHYRKLGFTPRAERPDGTTEWQLEVSQERLDQVPVPPMTVASLI